MGALCKLIDVVLNRLVFLCLGGQREIQSRDKPSKEKTMGALCKLIDVVLFLFFALMVFITPLIDAQASLPDIFFPAFLTDLNKWYSVEFEDYLTIEKPHFLVGLTWHEIVLLWPLSVANVYAMLAGKSWFSTTCLIYGASLVTSMAAILGDMIGSGKASNRLLMIYAPFMGIGILALLRGLVSQTMKGTGVSRKKPAILARRKHA